MEEYVKKLQFKYNWDNVDEPLYEIEIFGTILGLVFYRSKKYSIQAYKSEVKMLPINEFEKLFKDWKEIYIEEI